MSTSSASKALPWPGTSGSLASAAGTTVAVGNNLSLGAGSLGVSWPGLVSQLLAGNGTNVTVGSSLYLSAGTLSSAGPRTGLDASTVLAYYCNEISGTTLANSAPGNLYPLTLTGGYTNGSTSGRLGDRGLYSKGTGAIRFTGATTTDGAFNSSIYVGSLTSWTLECVMSSDYGLSTGLSAVEIGNANRSQGIQIATTDVALVVTFINTGYFTLTATMPRVFSRIHVGVTYTGTNNYLYINGVQVATSNTTNTWSGFTKFAIGNSTAVGANQAYRGCLADVRFSTTALTQNYMLNAATAAGAL